MPVYERHTPYEFSQRLFSTRCAAIKFAKRASMGRSPAIARHWVCGVGYAIRFDRGVVAEHRINHPSIKGLGRKRS